MRRSPDGKPIRKPRHPASQRTGEATYQHFPIPPGWKPRPWGGGVKLGPEDAMRGLGGGIRNDK